MQFPYNALIMCLCHEISVKHPHYDAATHQTNTKQLRWKESWKENLDLVLWLMRLIHCIWRFTQETSRCVPTHFVLLIQLLAFQLNFWTILSIKKTTRTFQTWFSANTDHLCSTFWAKVEKAKTIKEIFLVCLKQPTHKRIGWRSSGTVWILFRR